MNFIKNLIIGFYTWKRKQLLKVKNLLWLLFSITGLQKIWLYLQIQLFNFVFNYEKKRIYYKDLEVDSPYNTYKNKGLPPGPICNPTVSSVNAAYNPADTEYLFFVTKGGGEHFFSKTYKEHLDFQKNKWYNNSLYSKM